VTTADVVDLELLKKEQIVAILRSDDTRYFAQTVATLVAAGVRLMEFALTTPGALAALEAIRGTLPDDVRLGAGTVTTPTLVRQAVDAGATFLVTPALSLEVLAEAAKLNVPVLPGAMTPTEVLQAWEGGATAVKLFPASVGGPAYCRALREPFPSIPLVPTGGVSASNAAEYIAAGAIGLGVSRSLIGDATEGGSQSELAARASALLSAVRGGQSS